MTTILDAEFLASATSLEQLPAPMFAEIAFAGRSNVGKSSLINDLVQRKKLVRTSSTPGCTRGINLFRIKVRPEGSEDHAEIDFVDLPGYGYAQRSKTERKSWGPMIESFLRHRPGLRATVVIIDVRRGLEDEDAQLIEFLQAIDVRPILVATKLDKLAKNKQKLALQGIEKTTKMRVFSYSAVTSAGRDKLWRMLLRVAYVGDVIN